MNMEEKVKWGGYCKTTIKVSASAFVRVQKLLKK